MAMAAKYGWAHSRLLSGKTIIVTGSASGIGLETARLIKALGGDVLGVDVTRNFDHVDEFYRADLSDRRTILALVKALPEGVHGIANIAGLPPTAPAEMVLKVNLLGVKLFTEQMVEKLADGASIVNLASLDGIHWPRSVHQIKASEELAFEEVGDFMLHYNVTGDDGRSHVFAKEALIAWTLKNRWTWRDRDIRMNAVSPGPMGPGDPDRQEQQNQSNGNTADMGVMDRPGRPEDIAPVVAFLLSDMARWIRGSNIPVDGGMSSHIQCNIHDL